MNLVARPLTPGKLTLAAVFAALAYVSVVIFRLPIIPSAPFLNYDVKDVITALGALILGPTYGALIAVVVAFLEWITISSTGVIGFIMNVLSSASFVCTAAIIYSRQKTLANAVIGLVSGVVMMVIVMLLWNYIITPLYQGIPREAIANMLLPVFLPFNALKGSPECSFHVPAVSSGDWHAALCKAASCFDEQGTEINAGDSDCCFCTCDCDLRTCYSLDEGNYLTCNRGVYGVKTTAPEETRELGRRLAKKLKAGDVLLLWGDLGAGKSEFTRGLAQGLGVTATVTSRRSPSSTFTTMGEFPCTTSTGIG